MFNINECYKNAGSACTTYKLEMEYSVLNYLSMFNLSIIIYVILLFSIYLYVRLFRSHDYTGNSGSTSFYSICKLMYMYLSVLFF